jgi:hypothetical protein
VAQDRDQWRTLVIMAMKFRVAHKAGNLSTKIVLVNTLQDIENIIFCVVTPCIQIKVH